MKKTAKSSTTIRAHTGNVKRKAKHREGAFGLSRAEGQGNIQPGRREPPEVS
jgi:hypothetical protein